jgi:hypothetical protein
MNPIRKGLVVAVILIIEFSVIFPKSIGAFNYDITNDSQNPLNNIYFVEKSDVEVVLIGQMGNDNWFISCVDISFIYNPEDVVKIWYQIDGGNWTEFLLELTITICEDGEHIICWRYQDIHGNISDIECKDFSIDQTPPELRNFSMDIFKSDGSWWITFTIESIDATAGMDRVELYINDGIWATITEEGPVYSFTMEWSIAFKNLLLTFRWYDDAGLFKEFKIFIHSFRGFLFGDIENLTSGYKFNAVNLIAVRFIPFSYRHYCSGEFMLLYDSMFHTITRNFIFGYVKIVMWKIIDD